MDDIEHIDSEITPKRTHYTRTEIETIQTLIDEGCSTRDIAATMGRTVSGIRNLRRRLDLISKTEKRLPTLREQEKDLETSLQKLRDTTKYLQYRKEELTRQVTALEKEQTNLKPLVDYYRNHREEALQELRTLMRSEADLIGIQKVFQWLEGI